MRFCANLLDKVCYWVVMLDPRPPTGRGLRGWLLARAGRYAFGGRE
jgi:hypothetical protein